MSLLSLTYAPLRIARPKAEAALSKSLLRVGQISPVVVSGPKGSSFELLDGFKRVRILTRQGRGEILSRVVAFEKAPACKSLMLLLHGYARGLSELEEALIVQSLVREDGLSQVEVGVLLSRHKSWVSRRLALLERLSQEARENLVLGLLPLSVGRLLSQLPRGNQERMLACVLKHRLTVRECEALLRHLRHAGPSHAEALLREPFSIEPALSAPYSGKALDGHLKILAACAEGALPKLDSVTALPPECVPVARRAFRALEACGVALREALRRSPEEDF